MERRKPLDRKRESRENELILERENMEARREREQRKRDGCNIGAR
jgi:hypothetical protein